MPFSISRPVFHFHRYGSALNFSKVFRDSAQRNEVEQDSYFGIWGWATLSNLFLYFQVTSICDNLPKKLQLDFAIPRSFSMIFFKD